MHIRLCQSIYIQTTQHPSYLLGLVTALLASSLPCHLSEALPEDLVNLQVDRERERLLEVTWVPY